MRSPHADDKEDDHQGKGMIVGSRLCWLGLIACVVLGGCGKSEAVVEIALHPTKPNILYIATNDYIYKSRDEGRTWHNMSAGMTHSRVIALAIFRLMFWPGLKGMRCSKVMMAASDGCRDGPDWMMSRFPRWSTNWSLSRVPVTMFLLQPR